MTPKNYRVKLDALDGALYDSELDASEIFEGTFPQILIFCERAFYCTGSQRNGTIGLYRECVTASLKQINELTL